MNRIWKILDLLANILAALAGIAIIWLTLLICVSVFWRYVLNQPLLGIDDLTRMTLATIVAGSIAYGARRGAHVQVDVWNLFISEDPMRWADRLARVIGILIVGLTAYALWKASLCGFECGEYTDTLEIMHRPFYRGLSVGMGLYGLVLVAELFGPDDQSDAPGAGD